MDKENVNNDTTVENTLSVEDQNKNFYTYL